MKALFGRHECTHVETRIVYKIADNGVNMYTSQCVSCGARRSNWLKRPKNADSGIIPQFDYELEETGNDLTMAFFATKREEKDKAWWDRYHAHVTNRSPHWRRVSKKVMERDGGICQMCLERPATQVHHLTYEMLGCEPCHQLIAVCGKCHGFYHERKRTHNRL